MNMIPIDYTFRIYSDSEYREFGPKLKLPSAEAFRDDDWTSLDLGILKYIANPTIKDITTKAIIKAVKLLSKFSVIKYLFQD
jgi:hypothetical protein